ncbi:MAG TPA: transposase [Terriglobales bacterium]|nr:transposase [Terriglobales bacterium]
MSKGLRRYYGTRHLHFITCSCYRRQRLLGSARRRDTFLHILEQVRRKYDCVVVGYVVMPEHFHLLINELEEGSLGTVMQVLKQRVARKLLRPERRKDARQMRLWDEERLRHFWQLRFYDFNVWSERKRIEKLKYMHRNPVMRGLVTSPEQWRWSSYRYYAFGEAGPVKLNTWKMELRRIAG